MVVVVVGGGGVVALLQLLLGGFGPVRATPCEQGPQESPCPLRAKHLAASPPTPLSRRERLTLGLPTRWPSTRSCWPSAPSTSTCSSPSLAPSR
eukprot:11868638-Alexandrium_andersonii.AAC.1